ncbi:Putative ArgK-like periplasmic protein kinase [Melioribacter roseus P3M-2]|uniref:Putative ArgK-like periplasmic protein kinase n=1 Tax=Melioribacter roseus (strain DSM 23840 / JCM 17771 / VKM B-2668 / P3M-2) TaxID=1191523 RepID=I6Z953_MELRP|nr:methylmalonyl Co-A mutase-associated GTPase MeaB [Melioribacter roseus]AFN75675.1 Putative ArgK-like periplasmic protein kinase [Melioribacter roseus P3M-2]
MTDENFIKKVREQDKKTVSRAITLIESSNGSANQLLKSLHKFTGNAYRIGITGPPGAGKSTLTNQLTRYYRRLNKTVGIIAVDPTSPFSGGALLGDRIRMSDIGSDPGVFIRSMATRGSLGGLSKKAVEAADLLDAAQYDIIIFETVGVGQSELDIAKAADTTVVVLVPESGDSIQAMKAGLMEIADIFVINKSDRQGVDATYTALTTILHLYNRKEVVPEVIKTVASENKGIEELAVEIEKHRKSLIESNLLESNRMNKLKERILENLNYLINEEISGIIETSLIHELAELTLEGKLSYVEASELLLNKYKQKLLGK